MKIITGEPAPSEGGLKRNAANIIRSLLISAVFIAGRGLAYRSLFPSASGKLWVTVVACAVACAVSVLALNCRKWAVAVGSVSAAFLLPLIIFSDRVADGMVNLRNDITGAIGTVNGRIILDLLADEPKNIYFALVALGILSAFIVSYSVSENKPVVAVLWLLPYFAAAISGVSGFGAEVFLFALGLLLLVSGRALPSVKSGAENHISAVSLIVIITAAALLVSAKAAISTAGARDGITAAAHSARYHETQLALPEGRIDGLAPLNSAESEALVLEIDKPAMVYLRGFTGDKYTGQGWKKTPFTELNTWKPLFYQLNKEGFRGESAFGTAAELSGVGDVGKMKLGYKGACEKFAFVPVSIVGNDAFRGDTVGETAIRQKDTAEYEYVAGAVDPAAIKAALENSGDPAAEAFLKSEREYRDYVFATQLGLTPSARAILEKVFENSGKDLDFAQIASAVNDALDKYISYNESPEKAENGGELLTQILSGHGGYCVHYATAAALMLRYFGIPARYAEGYYLSADDAAQARDGIITVTEKNAHAWAEYYAEGVGWVPFETTPGYGFINFAADSGDGTAELAEKETDIGEQPKPEEPEPEPEKEPQDVTGRSENEIIIVFPLGLLLLLLLLLIAAAVIIRARVKAGKRLKEIENADNREAVILEYRYSVLLRKNGAQPEPELAKAAEELKNEAEFSNHKITEQARSGITQYRNDLLERGKKQWKPFRKAYLKFVKGLY